MRKQFLTVVCALLFGDFAPATELEQLEKAAMQGEGLAQEELGRRYMVGDGVKLDFAKAAALFRRACESFRSTAEQGSAEGQFNLGEMYDSGRGVEKNAQTANEWYRKAAEQGHGRAQLFLSFDYEHGYSGPKDAAKALEWLTKSAEGGYYVAQIALGRRYQNGDGVPKDGMKAIEWFRNAAIQGNVKMQMSVSLSYQLGLGVPKDEIEALAWLNIAAAAEDRLPVGKLVDGEFRSSDGYDDQAFRIKSRNLLEAHIGRQATLLAQQRSKEILKEMEAAKRAQASTEPKDSAAAISPTGERPKASGSGAIVSTEGHVLTVAHVVAGSSRVNVLTVQGMKAAKVLRVDEANDLAILKLSDETFSALPIAPSRNVRLGQAVATIGFPNVEIQGFSPKITKGEISSVNGIGDDPRAWQISVPVQPGNSGGALLDESGNVIGVVVSKLGLKAAKATGDIPQNVSYAVKSTYALALLESYLGNNAPAPNEGGPKLSFEDMVAKAQESVVLILVY